MNIINTFNIVFLDTQPIAFMQMSRQFKLSDSITFQHLTIVYLEEKIKMSYLILLYANNIFRNTAIENTRYKTA